MSNQPRVIEIFYFDAGGGHRSAMCALSDVITERHPDWIVKPVNLQELLEPIDPVYKVTDKLSAIREVLDEIKPKLSPALQKPMKALAEKLTFKALQSDQFYNELLKRGVKSNFDVMLLLLQKLIRLGSRPIQKLLRQYWLQTSEKPDLVISVIPNFNAVLFKALKKVFPEVPYVTILTDMVDIPPHFWMEDQDQIMICGSVKAYQQAIKSGFYRPGNVHLVSGMILKKFFYAAPAADDPTLESLGLRALPEYVTALVMFGGNGSSIAETIVDRLTASGLKLQTIVMCGNNKDLHNKLKNKKKCCPVPFVANVAPYMRLADFMIGKPGPGSISEALHCGCPVVIESNALTMPQERPNVVWVRENGIGCIIKDFATDIVDATRHMIENLLLYRDAVAHLKENRSVFEIADILEKIMERPAAWSANENRPNALSKKWSLRRKGARR